ncbi:MAG TPA: vitamin B12 dependent-methionine synthase activation domain-containing protein, partial [Terriglobales bacterium]|nr:vitamin B12 dependent-methionine synthase activation domain-containing protein [Terriglobales bacterium]
CGGAALTRKYVEDDLRREYSSAVFYADDAFSGLHYMESLVGEDRSAAIEQGTVVKEFARAAVATGENTDTTPSAVVHPAPDIPQPPFWGVRVRRDFDLPTLFQYINETALFKNQWQLKTASQQDYARLVEEKYRPILMGLEEEVMREGWFDPKVVYGFFPCQSDGNSVIVYDPIDGLRAGSQTPASLKEIQRFTFPRQREGRKLCISDFFLSKCSGRLDVLGLSVVTIGDRASHETQKLFESGEYTKYLYLHGLSVETAEALAEYMHKVTREEMGIGKDDAECISDLFHQKYRGSRYSFGYPACPNLEDQTKLFALLKPEEAIGVRLTTGFLLEPEQSTSAIIVHHPTAKYFVA